MSQQVGVESFVDFAERTSPRLKAALVAAVGIDRAPDAAAEALEYGWEHWDRVRSMEIPAGYLYRIGVSRGRRRRPLHPVLPVPPSGEMPWVEPGLPKALSRLSEKQRVVVLLVHSFGWTQEEAAELLGVSRATAQTHLERGMRRLRSSLGVAT
jgi:DNA-directed RNA polymerase specialized sigma24 family protein